MEDGLSFKVYSVQHPNDEEFIVVDNRVVMHFVVLVVCDRFVYYLC